MQRRALSGFGLPQADARPLLVGVDQHALKSFGVSENEARLVVEGIRTVGDGGAFERRPGSEPERGAPALRPRLEGRARRAE
jgi:monovalent cation:H+ antiporter-2, CPA2 family